MPINELVRFAHSEYSKKQLQCLECPNKEQGQCSSCNCSMCFQDMFFRKGRTFNCIYSTNSYVCRYIYQYSSEILHLLKQLRPFFIDENMNPKFEKLNILSIGCGPCSEAFAFDLFLKEISYTGAVIFNGYDSNVIWETTHAKVKSVLPFEVNIFSENCFDHINSAPNYEFPNILIMNYLLSDICKHGNIDDFINNVVENIIDKMPPKSAVIINDINFMNPRDYYKSLIDKVNINNNAGHASLSIIGYNYGNRYNYNHTFFSLTEKSINFLVKNYGTKTSCTSAQLVIFKKSNK